MSGQGENGSHITVSQEEFTKLLHTVKQERAGLEQTEQSEQSGSQGKTAFSNDKVYDSAIAFEFTHADAPIIIQFLNKLFHMDMPLDSEVICSLPKQVTDTGDGELKQRYPDIMIKVKVANSQDVITHHFHLENESSPKNNDETVIRVVRYQTGYAYDHIEIVQWPVQNNPATNSKEEASGEQPPTEELLASADTTITIIPGMMQVKGKLDNNLYTHAAIPVKSFPEGSEFRPSPYNWPGIDVGNPDIPLVQMTLPNSAYIFLGTDSLKYDYFWTRIQIPLNQSVYYKVPILRITDYDVASLLKENPLILLPFVICAFSSRELREFEINNNLSEIEKMLHEIHEGLRKLSESNDISEKTEKIIVEQTHAVFKERVKRYEHLSKGVDDVITKYKDPIPFNQMWCDEIEARDKTIEACNKTIEARDKTIEALKEENAKLQIIYIAIIDLQRKLPLDQIKKATGFTNEMIKQVADLYNIALNADCTDYA